jgi:IclR family acetate operon transcriptional repressor
MQALDRLLRIIEGVASARGGATPTEVAAKVGLSLSTVSRMMNQLADEAVIEKSRATGKFRLGLRLLEILQMTSAASKNHGAIQAVMTSLRDRSRETISLHIRVGNQRVCIESVPSRHAVARIIPLGEAQPLVGSASGEVVLAGVPDGDLQRVLDSLALSGPAERALKKRLDRIRADGWAIYEGKLVSGVTGAAAVVPGYGSEVGALSVSGPAERFQQQDIEAILPALRAGARRIGDLNLLARNFGPNGSPAD